MTYYVMDRSVFPPPLNSYVEAPISIMTGFGDMVSKELKISGVIRVGP